MAYATHGYGTVLTGMMTVTHCPTGIPDYRLRLAAAVASGGADDAEYQAYLDGTRRCNYPAPMSYADFRAWKAKQAAAAAAKEAAIQAIYKEQMAACIERGGFIRKDRQGNVISTEPCEEKRVRAIAEREYMLQGAQAVAVAAPVKTNGADIERLLRTDKSPPQTMPPGTDISDLTPTSGVHRAPPAPRRGAGMLWLGAAAAALLALR